MSRTIGSLAVTLSANSYGFTAGMMSAQRGLSSFASNFLATAGKVTGIVGAISLGKTLIDGFIGDQEDTLVMKGFLGDAILAKQLVDDIEAAAHKTTFASAFQPAAETLLKFNVAASNVVPTLNSLADIAAGTRTPIGELAQLYGEASNKLEFSSKTLTGFANVGVPLIEHLTQKFGVSKEAVLQMAEAGQLGFGDLQEAIKAVTGEGGRFHQFALEQGMTTLGSWNRAVQGGVGIIGEFGESLGGALANTFGFQDGLSGLADWMETVRQSAGGLGTFLEINFKRGRLAFSVLSDDFIHFFSTNIPELFSWFGRNWREIWDDALTFAGVAIRNLGENLANFFRELPKLIANSTMGEWWQETKEKFMSLVVTVVDGHAEAMDRIHRMRLDFLAEREREGGFAFMWKPLGEGFESKLKEGFAFTRRELTEAQKALRDDIGRLALEANAPTERMPLGNSSSWIWPWNRQQSSPGEIAVRSTGKQYAGAFERGTREAYSALLAARGQGSRSPADDTAKATAQIAAQGKTANNHLKSIDEKLKDPIVLKKGSLNAGGG